MYIQFKHGFIEADRWDGAALPIATHQQAIDAAFFDGGRATQPIIVVRSREKETILWCIRQTSRRPVVFASPPEWDYEWRCYLALSEWKQVLCAVAESLDYRNFKSWSSTNSNLGRVQLAKDIWHVAHDAGTGKSVAAVERRNEKTHSVSAPTVEEFREALGGLSIEDAPFVSKARPSKARKGLLRSRK